MKTWICGLLLCLSASVLAAEPLNKIIVFGDCLSDTGNFYEYMRHAIPLSPPYYKGRFSNGPLWIEHVLEHYYPKDAEAHFSNYAFVGAGIGTGEEDDDEEFEEDDVAFDLAGQIKQYLRASEDKADSSTLYVFWVGADNYLSQPSDLDAEINLTIEGIRLALETLVAKGAQHILVLGLPDMGIIPRAREMNEVDEMHYLSTQHNIKLLVELEQLRQRYPNVQLIHFEVATLFMDSFHHPEKYNLKNVTDTCFDALGYFELSQQVSLGLFSRRNREYSTMKDNDICDTYLFVDGAHPSGRAHQHLGEKVVAYLDKAGVEFG